MGHSSNKSGISFYAHGKLLLSGEYFVLNGAKSLAAPTKLGQFLQIDYKHSYSPKLFWKSYDSSGRLWFEASFEFWHFNLLNGADCKSSKFLQKILKTARKLNGHFLREECDVHVKSVLEFPLDWGLGASSSLIYNIAQWAYVSPFELLKESQSGSGYDIACAQSDGPITFTNENQNPSWELIDFSPEFRDNLYFVWQGNKQDTEKAILHYKTLKKVSNETISEISSISELMSITPHITEFQDLMQAHERIVNKVIGLPIIGKTKFKDFKGQLKSLGAWGGDFMLAATELPKYKVQEYFNSKKLYDIIPFDEMIICRNNFQKRIINDTPNETSIHQ